jgi:hypothetical protein
MSGLGNNLNDLRRRIQKAQDDLAQIGAPEPPHPELINTANLLRANEYLTKTDQKKTELLSAYEEYAKQLEQAVTSLLSIQADLNAVRAQASRTKRKKPRKKQSMKEHKKTKRRKVKKHKKTKKRKK